MIDHGVFGPPEEPPPGTKVLKTGTVCRGTYCNGELVKRKVRIVVKGYSQIGILTQDNERKSLGHAAGRL
jgi:hypothetical protein